MATAASKITAARVTVGDRILVKEADQGTLKSLGVERALDAATTKTRGGVTVARVLHVEAVTVTGGRRQARVYNITTTEGTLGNNAPAQTILLAPEGAAGVTRAHVEALAINDTMDAYPVATQEVEGVHVLLDASPEELEADAAALVAEMELDAAEFQFPTPICSDTAPHAKHRIAGTWRTECPGVPTQGERDWHTAWDGKGNVIGSGTGQRSSLAAGSASVITGGQGQATTVQAVDPADLLEDPARVVVGDVVRIHRGTRLYEVLRVERDQARDALDSDSRWEITDMARLVPCDPEDTREPGWINTDLLHRVPPVARVRTVIIGAHQELGDDPVVVAGIVRRVGTVTAPGSRNPTAVPWPADVEPGQAVGCLRTGDAIVINNRCHRAAWDGGPAEPVVDQPSRWRDR